MGIFSTTTDGDSANEVGEHLNTETQFALTDTFDVESFENPMYYGAEPYRAEDQNEFSWR
jgi:hypothetical protein